MMLFPVVVARRLAVGATRQRLVPTAARAHASSFASATKAAASAAVAAPSSRLAVLSLSLGAVLYFAAFRNSDEKNANSSLSNTSSASTSLLREPAMPAMNFVSDEFHRAPENQNPQSATPQASTHNEKKHANDNSQAEGLITEEEKRFKYVIIGGSTAAINAIKAIQEKEQDAEILCISDSKNPPYKRIGISKPGLEKIDKSNEIQVNDNSNNKNAVFYRKNSDYVMWNELGEPTGKDLKLLLGTRALSIDVGRKAVTLENGKRLSFDKLLIATGYKPSLTLDDSKISLEARKKLLMFNYLEDHEKLTAALESAEKTRVPARIAIVGGQILGAELASTLSAYPNAKVTNFLPQNSNVLSCIFPNELSQYVEDGMRKSGVVFEHTPGIPIVLEPKPGSIALAAAPSAPIQEFDLVIVEGRAEPNADIAEPSNLEIDSATGGIAVTPDLMARADVYAAGAVASYYDVSLGMRRVSPAYEAASTQGYIAGTNMASDKRPRAYTYQPSFSLYAGGAVIEGVGIVERGADDSEDNKGTSPVVNAICNAPGDGGHEKRCVVFYSNANTKRIVGVAGVNLPTPAGDEMGDFLQLARKIVRSRFKAADVKYLAKMMPLYDKVPEEPSHASN